MKKLNYYDPNYVRDIGEIAKRFLLARDAYIGAWLEWQDTCLGAGLDPEQESQTIMNLLENALKEKNDGGQ